MPILFDPIWALRAFFLGASALILVLNAFEPLRSRFLTYGSRLTPPQAGSTKKDDQNVQVKDSTKTSTSPISSVLDGLASIRVPHNYFAHFYICAIATSLLWTHQLLTHGALFSYLAARVPSNTPSMTPTQVVMMNTLLLVQAVRRLGESYAFARRSSTSQMWVVHYILGLLFYLCLATSIWIEGAPAIAALPPHIDASKATATLLHSPSSLTFADVKTLLYALTPTSILTYLPKPTYSIIWLLPVLFVASGLQHDVHQHLSTLPPGPNYKQPTHPAFSVIIAPHYFFEVLIYLVWTFLAAPEDGWGINITLLCALVFVVVNLGVTAQGTKQWWRRRWGAEAVEGKWTMIPKVF